MQRASRPPQDRTMVVACLAEVAQNMGPPIVDYIDVISFFIYFLSQPLSKGICGLFVKTYAMYFSG